MKANYGHHPAQLGQLAVLSSPPYGNVDINFAKNGIDKSKRSVRGHFGQHLETQEDYGTDARQLQRRDYWSAMRGVYLECARILAPGAPLLLVLKGYVKNGQYVDLPAQTAALLEQCGFEIVHWHQVSLVAREAQRELFVEEHGEESRRMRKSFFRRLAEKKGAPPIDHEVVLCAERR